MGVGGMVVWLELPSNVSASWSRSFDSCPPARLSVLVPEGQVGRGVDGPDEKGRSRGQAPGRAARVLQGRLWNARGGLAALANDSTGELTLGQLPVPTAMLCYTSRGGTRDCVFCVWEETLSASCGQSVQLWPARCLALRLGASPGHHPQGPPGTVFCVDGRPND